MRMGMGRPIVDPVVEFMQQNPLISGLAVMYVRIGSMENVKRLLMQERSTLSTTNVDPVVIEDLEFRCFYNTCRQLQWSCSHCNVAAHSLIVVSRAN